MKKSKQIVGLPIISISDGNQIGAVRSLVINPDKGSIDFITIEHEDWQVSVKAIPFKKVVGIGEYAVTVESENAIIDLNEIPIANQLVNKKIKITDTKVMTRKGELLGEISEYYVDEDNGNILGALLHVSDREYALPSESVLTYGKDIIIVKEDAATHFLESVDELDVANIRNEDTSMSSDLVDDLVPFNDKEAAAAAYNGEVQAIKDKQIDILQGKSVTKDIHDKSGKVLIAAGTLLTEKEIVKAQQEGPSVIVELSMNVDSE